jgi:hypothetical protein
LPRNGEAGEIRRTIRRLTAGVVALSVTHDRPDRLSDPATGLGDGASAESADTNFGDMLPPREMDVHPSAPPLWERPMDGIVLTLFVLAAFAGGFISGFSGFAMGLVVSGVWLHVITRCKPRR